jgi:hypothetical protein
MRGCYVSARFNRLHDWSAAKRTASFLEGPDPMTLMQSDLILMVVPGTDIPELLFDLECHGVEIVKWDRDSSGVEVVCPADAMYHLYKEQRIQYVRQVCSYTVDYGTDAEAA